MQSTPAGRHGNTVSLNVRPPCLFFLTTIPPIFILNSPEKSIDLIFLQYNYYLVSKCVNIPRDEHVAWCAVSSHVNHLAQQQRILSVNI